MSKIIAIQMLNIVPAQRACLRKVQRTGLGREAHLDPLILRASRVGFERQHLASAVDDRELVDEPLELRDEVRRDEHRPASRRAVLIRADDGLDELAADDGIQSGGGLVEHEQVRLGADGGDERELRALPFRQRARLLRLVELELPQQRPLGLPVPVFPEGGDVGERLAHRHPRVERHATGHVGDRDFTATSSLAGSSPKILTSPPVGCNRLSRHLIVVVLPAPLRPKKP